MEPAHTDAKAPEQLGEFRIHAELGRGGSGVVYDASWGPRRVALKVLNEGASGYLEEAQRLQQIGHPSVVKVLAAGELPDGRPFLAMERLDGETLAHLIARGRLPLDRSLALFAELCSAVTALHDRGLVHRDLKPENVFVVSGQHAVLLDFGIAKDLAAPASTTTQEGNVRGTPAYMAPERFFGQPAGITTDIYELALILYAMLAGQLPWHDSADPEARLSPIPLTELASVPDPLDVEIRRALSTRAQNRPASASALYTAVHAAASGDREEPGADETARLRAANKDPLPDQPTPLAWAPTQAAPQVSTQKHARKRWPYLAAAAVAAAGTAAYVKHVSSKTQDALVDTKQAALQKPIAKPDPNDPWSAKPEKPTKELPLVAEAAPVDKSRVAAANAITHLPPDSNVVISVIVDDLHANKATQQMLEKLDTDPKTRAVTSDLPECMKALAKGSEWAVFGTPKLDTNMSGALIVSGRWQKADVIDCFADGATMQKTASGAVVYQLADTGWIDFLDDHTAYIVLHENYDAEKLHALVTKPTVFDPVMKKMLARLPADRTIAFAISGKAKVDWSGMLLLPAGSDVFGWGKIDPAKGVTIDAGADTHSAKAAAEAAKVITPQFADAFSTNDGVGKLVTAIDGNEVHVKGTLTNFTLGMVAATM
ncbi:MAG: serine/threonine-protein kinase [Kofleriaceae bacterium]